VTRPEFDPCGPLPQGTVVLEASAGTGKTHTIAALAARYVAEGVARIEEMMLVTFGRAATVELRERVRERLVSTCAALARPDAARSCRDAVVRHLATGTEEEVAVRRERLAGALATFDSAMIATTHGFCHQMLAGLGIAADVYHEVAFVEATTDIVTEAVTDLYVRAYGRSDSAEPPFDFATAQRVATDAVDDRTARLEPLHAAPDSEADLRRRLAERVRTEVARRKRTRRVMDYDDLLLHVRDALKDPATGADAQARIRARYSVVLVDEFQDTDPVQWEILQTTFHGHRTLVLIGDPKQAIYAFRGADVVTYLLATAAAGTESTLGTNWRSERPLLDALGHLMGGVALGDSRIVVHPVGAATAGRSLSGRSAQAPLRLRVVRRDGLPVGRNNLISVKEARAFVAGDVASDIVSLLESGCVLTERESPRPLAPADIAVLVHRNEDGRTVRDRLQAVGVPVVLTGTSSVFLSDAAADWLTLLTALEQPQRPGLARAAALTSFVGWTAEQLAADDGATFDELSARMREWGEVLSSRGVAALLEVVTATNGLTARVLSRVQGERDLTDLRHVGQALHEEATEDRLGVASLVEWLQRRIADAKDDVSEERSRRLESDAKAVQIITVHRAKGLEFPVVYAPFLWDRFVFTNPDPLEFHDEDGVRVLDVGGPGGAEYAHRRDRHAAEEAGESLRLAYVALTRARSQVVTYWAPTSNTRCAPLHRLLFSERAGSGALPDGIAVGSDDFVRERLARLSAGSEGAIRVETATGGSGQSWQPPAADCPDLAVRGFDRTIDLAWTRTSYSGLTAGLHDHPLAGEVSSEAEEPGIVDEPAEPGPAIEKAPSPAPSPAPMSPSPMWLASPMSALPTGAAFGTLVHTVLETTDFTAPDLRSHLTKQCSAAGSQRFAGVPPDDLADALAPSLLTPLGPLAHGRRLADIACQDRLDELEFELPLVGGDTPTGEARVGQIADLLAQHLHAGDPLAGYAADLAAPVLSARQLRGFLTGSIDAVLRIRVDEGVSRYLVVDYKSNWLGAGDALSAWDYRQDAMARAMRQAHYPLQALLYSVALHRFLRWRQAGYDPSVHLGGVLYLFLRGMCGPETPVVGGTPCGVFPWAPPAGLVVGLSDLLDRGAS
jgi:exodeoxyribonuclease V beta subunit